MTESVAVAARNRASALVESLSIAKPEHIDIELIAAHCGAFVDYRDLQNQEGHIVRSGSVARVVVDNSARERSNKWRFVIAHELGHFLLHPALDQFKLCTSAELGRWYREGDYEYTANVFAGELLMPGALFAPASARLPPTLDDVAALANKFSTSLTATALRYVELSLRPCAAVYSSASRIRWVVSSPSFELFIERRSTVSPDTCAGELFAGGSAPDRPQPVSASAWSADEAAAGITLEEHSRLLGNYGVLSLLSL